MDKVSIITVVRNNSRQIENCIQSVLGQDYGNMEYIIIDGGSTDGTLDVIRKYEKDISRWISEPDRGIYDAMNKGVRIASGDIVGILNSDDFYVSGHIISEVIREFDSKKVESVFADLVYVNDGRPDEVVRYYKSANFTPEKFAYGWMPAHPTFFVKRNCYEKYGYFKTDFEIASDYELLVRFLFKGKISFSYIPKVLVKMRTGGVSTRNLRSNFVLNREIVRACRENGMETNLLKVYSKYISKWFQLLNRPA